MLEESIRKALQFSSVCCLDSGCYWYGVDYILHRYDLDCICSAY